MAAAETGSGKTGAFALPLLQIVHEALAAKEKEATQAQRWEWREELCA
jgi:ATP-dependent RNA helicase DDX1